MKILLYPDKSTWPSLCKRPASNNTDIDPVITEILRKVKEEGDSALRHFSEQFDGIKVRDFRVPDQEIAGASDLVPESLKEAIEIARTNIEKFHRNQVLEEKPIETSAGVRCWRKNVPIEKAGLYIPGGTAPLFSTLLMLAIPASIAGCKRTIMCSPPTKKNGSIDPLILYAASISGVTDVFMAGGAQAIAAMAYGTESIPGVNKVFGPGNRYVTRAKEMVQLDGVQIDMPAGPSEVLVIADSTGDPSFVASDLLSQAEHGTDSQVVLLTDCQELTTNVRSEVEKQLSHLPRKKIAEKSLENSLLVVLSSVAECMEFSNCYAPEHLIISTSDPAGVAENAVNAGSVFLGKYSCESAGDYASGTNHTLPTNGYAKSYSGVSVGSFMKSISFQEISPAGIKSLGPSIELMAAAEELEGHRNAVKLRLNSLRNV